MVEHLPQRLEVAGAIVVQCLPQHSSVGSIWLREDVIREVQQGLALAFCTSTEGILRSRLRVGRPRPDELGRVQHNVVQADTWMGWFCLHCCLRLRDDHRAVGKLAHALSESSYGRPSGLPKTPEGLRKHKRMDARGQVEGQETQSHHWCAHDPPTLRCDLVHGVEKRLVVVRGCFRHASSHSGGKEELVWVHLGNLGDPRPFALLILSHFGQILEGHVVI
mmetsp:Transcript_48392/g.138247  ORF Transcript_48392/g.138247 Transcript_48392/m.138247 type:complete len:221 (-) Transcript_48392:815-1477(-)